MNGQQPARHLPTTINLHQKSRILCVEFADGQHFELPCEYLRVFSKAAEVRTMEQPVVGKEKVNIISIEPQGNYAIRLVFNDGHDTGIYSWDSLYQLGQNKEQNWQAYLAKLQNLGYQRQEDTEQRQVKILYFAHLAQRLHREAEVIILPTPVKDVAALLSLLSLRKPEAAPLFVREQLCITVNRQFAEPFTLLADGDEVALVPSSPTLPPTPGLI